jgi:Cu(I)/Ag(I) efflux system membrane fusion protein
MSELHEAAMSDAKEAMTAAEKDLNRTGGPAMNTPKKRATNIALGLFLLGIGLAAGWWWGQRSVESPAAETAPHGERAVLYWYDPMVPQHRFDEPGKSPFMDMQLVPRYADEGTADAGSRGGVSIDARVAQNLGLREARVERIALASLIEASGLLGFNERDVAIEQVRSAGLVERVWPLAPGDVIKTGQPLIELRAPLWSAAQAEFLALRHNDELALAARERLRMLGQSDAMIADLERSGKAQQTFVLRSSRAGVLQTLDVRSGMNVEPGQTVARIQGIDSLWLEVAVPESRAASVHTGGEARVELAASPGDELSGRIVAVLPELAPGSRTLRIRIELPNPRGELRAGMSAQVRLATQSGDTALAVPTEAIIRTGKRALVMAVRKRGEFEPVEVQLGPEIENYTVIAGGLAEGQRIVSSAQFLLDSEANLSGAFATGEQP